MCAACSGNVDRDIAAEFGPNGARQWKFGDLLHAFFSTGTLLVMGLFTQPLLSCFQPHLDPVSARVVRAAAVLVMRAHSVMCSGS